MVRAGFKTLLLGIESPHDKVLTQLNKGFNSNDIRRYFSELRKYPLFYHGYFIYGNMGESEEDMLYIAEFAKEIGVDSITFLKLRIEKFSPLKEIVESTSGYYIESNGVVCSDKYSYSDLKKIGKKIKFSFYRPSRYIKILKKAFAIRFFTFRDIASLALALPVLLVSILSREVQKGRLFDSLKRTFVHNA